MNITLKKIGKYLVALPFFLFPFFAHATTYWPSGGNYTVGCGSSVVTGANVSIFVEGCSSDNISFSTVNGTTYYFTFSSNGTGHIQFQEASGAGHQVFANNNASTTFSITANSAGDYFQFGGGTTNWSSDMNGNLTSLCISDVSYAECAGGGGTPPTNPGVSFTSSISNLFTLASSTCVQTNIDHTATTTFYCTGTSTQPVGVPYGDWLIMNGLIVFFLGFIAISRMGSVFKFK